MFKSISVKIKSFLLVFSFFLSAPTLLTVNQRYRFTFGYGEFPLRCLWTCISERFFKWSLLTSAPIAFSCHLSVVVHRCLKSPFNAQYCQKYYQSSVSGKKLKYLEASFLNRRSVCSWSPSQYYNSVYQYLIFMYRPYYLKLFLFSLARKPPEVYYSNFF